MQQESAVAAALRAAPDVIDVDLALRTAKRLQKSARKVAKISSS